MPENLLIPSVDLRIGALEEYNRRQELKADQHRKLKQQICITISREFGCEAYPVAERLRELMTQRTGTEWLVMDKALLQQVAQRHNISEHVLRGLGEKSRILDEVLSTFSPSWKSNADHFRLLSSHIVSLAAQGNVIIVGRGSAVIARHLENCRHFRLYATLAFKKNSIARRLNMQPDDAEKFINKKQAQRDRFVSDFLNQDAGDMKYYNLLFNNDKNPSDKIALTIADYVLTN